MIPKAPKKPAKIVKENLIIVLSCTKEGVTKEVMAVRAITITNGAPTRPAVTVASPITRAPTMLIVWRWA